LDAKQGALDETIRRGYPIAEVLLRLHAGPRFRDDFDMGRVAERYLALVDQRLETNRKKAA
jgi:hypothetical protein